MQSDTRYPIPDTRVLPMEAVGRIKELIYAEGPECTAIDAVGIGAGVADRLLEMGLAVIEPVNVGLPAREQDRFANRRAELYWSLRERFRQGKISIPADERMVQELSGLRYRITSRGQVQIESKEEMKRRGLGSPDRADTLALLFDGGGEAVVGVGRWAFGVGPSEAARLREEMEGW